MIQSDTSCGLHHLHISLCVIQKHVTEATQSCVGRSVLTHPAKMRISTSTGAGERHLSLLSKLPSICGPWPFVIISSNLLDDAFRWEPSEHRTTNDCYSSLNICQWNILSLCCALGGQNLLSGYVVSLATWCLFRLRLNPDNIHQHQDQSTETVVKMKKKMERT